MPDSAITGRDRRREETARALTRAARAATAEHGLSGFTIEDLCDAAGVSRRTFFNYFASKEDAVLGMPLQRGDEEAVAAFLAGGTASGELSPTLLVHLAELTEVRWRVLDIAPDSVRELVAAVKREPRLLGRMLEHGLNDERADAALIIEREGLAPDDLRAPLAAQLMGALCRAASEAFLAPGNTDPFSVLFERRIGAAADLFASQIPQPLLSTSL
ncbi:TetR/AcrR family transcriptional regulator [Microbacterium sp. P04]|uniref:TetR/AcrR family transcriptional regulator n=1 Tax=Microbacterium sp. P04 TaxID=3366947 RepID=UPI0037456BEA